MSQLEEENASGGELLVQLLWIPISMFIFGTVLLCYWSWFLIPLGAPSIGMAHALGLSVLLRAITFQWDETPHKHKPLWFGPLRSLMFNGAVWLVGRILVEFL